MTVSDQPSIGSQYIRPQAKTVRIFVWLLSTGLLVAAETANAQAPNKLPRIGFLSGGSPSTSQSNIAAFRQGLKDLGYFEGTNVGVTYRFAEGQVERLPALASELVALKPDVILAGGTPPAMAAKKATKTIAIVFVNVADPLRTRLAASLARPAANLTGLSTVNSDLTLKRFELLKESVGGVSRVAFLRNPSDASNVLGSLKNLQDSARPLALTIHPFNVRDAAQFEAAFVAMVRERMQALLVLAGTLTSVHRERIVDLARNARLPTIYGEKRFVEVGGLMSYAADFVEQYRYAAIYVDKILKGAKPAELPVEQPTKFELVINLNAAKQIGLTIPANVLARANRVIK